jgi:hypothetical protein
MDFIKAALGGFLFPKSDRSTSYEVLPREEMGRVLVERS